MFAISLIAFPGFAVESDEQLDQFDGFAFSATTDGDPITDLIYSDSSLFADGLSNFTLVALSSNIVTAVLNTSYSGGRSSYSFNAGSTTFSVPSNNNLCYKSVSNINGNYGLTQSFGGELNSSSMSFFLNFGSVSSGSYITDIRLTGSLSLWLGLYTWTSKTFGLPSSPSPAGSTLSGCTLGFYDSSNVFHPISSFSPSQFSVSFDSTISYSVNSAVSRIGIKFDLSSIPSGSRSTYVSIGYYGYVYYHLGITSQSFSGVSEDNRTDVVKYVVPRLDEILASIGSNLWQMVKNGFDSVISAITGSRDDPTPSQSQAASDFKDSAQDQKDKIDQAQEEIDQSTNRPPPESLVPSTPPIIVDGQIGGGDEVALSAVTGVSDLLGSQLILSMLLLVFTLAFVSYVLFGKKG